MSIQLIYTDFSILQLIFIAFLAACLELAFQAYMKKNMLLAFWWVIIDNMHCQGGLKRKLAMVLGHCAYCNGFWVSTGIYLAFYKDISLTLMLFNSMNYIMIVILNKLYIQRS